MFVGISFSFPCLIMRAQNMSGKSLCQEWKLDPSFILNRYLIP